MGPREIADELYYLHAARQAGVIQAESPRKIVAAVKAMAKYGQLGASIEIAAMRHPDSVALVDERGRLTYRELDERSNALANALLARGLEPGDGVSILARNHRGFIDATFGIAKAGGRAIYLNTDFAGPQIREVALREGTKMLIHDDEYAPFLEGVEPPLGRFRAWVDDAQAPYADDTLDGLIAAGNTAPPPKPAEQSSVVILTSGTTGTPKGAPRPSPKGLGILGALVSKVPFRAGEATVNCAPMFHALGFAHAVIAVGLGSKLVIHRRFKPEWMLESVEREGATALIVVPVMLQRMLSLGADELAKYDTSSLRIVFVGGSQLGAETCVKTIAALGPVVYNLYGSTEASFATIATPEDLAVEPACVGSPPRGVVVKIFGEQGQDVPTGQVGRIFVGNRSAFEGYTGGGNKEVVRGLMSTGDVGHLDSAGRLFVDGRDDEMIVSGGENVFPREIEELLLGHESIDDAAAIGVADETFGQRLKAFVVAVDGSGMTEDAVKEHVRENLARYKVPREVVFLDELPRNPSGKVLKRELAEL